MMNTIKIFLDSVVRHPTFNQCTKDIVQCSKSIESGPYGLAVFCEPGVGKSMLCDYCTKELNKSARQTDERKQVKAIKIDLNGGATVKELKRSIICKINGDYADRYSGAKLDRYLSQIIKEARVRVVIIDEFHHLLRGEKKLDTKVAQFVKSLIDNYRVGVVIVGTPEAQRIFAINEELNTRFIASNTLTLFSCDTETNKDYFKEFIKRYQANSPIPMLPLNTEDMIYRLELATGGNLRRIRLLFQRVLLNHGGNESKITKADFHKAHQQLRVFKAGTEKENIVWPFSPSTTLTQVKKALYYA